MFRKLYQFYQYLKLKAKNDLQMRRRLEDTDQQIPQSASVLRDRLAQTFAECSDFICREVVFGEKPSARITIAYLDGMVSKEIIQANVLKPLLTESRVAHLTEFNHRNFIYLLRDKLLSACEVKEVIKFADAVDEILSGETLIFIEGQEIALRVGTKGWEGRNVSEPDTESVVRGPREGFVENIRVNTTLVRRKVKSPRFKLERMKIGSISKTEVCIGYIKGIAREDVVDTVKRRLGRIEIDAILESGYIEQFIEDAPYSIFPTVGNSEKPDVVAGRILEGRVAIFCDGTPFVLTVPYLFVETFQASEDYYSRNIFASVDRMLRVIAIFVTLTLPALYVAFVGFHQDAIPFQLLLTMASSREGIPFSAFTEALLMGGIFEILREAGVRMPRPVGQAVSIVGALVLGESAVQAGLASNPMVIVTALTAICSFLVPPLRGVFPLLRIFYLIAANVLGFLGIALALITTIIHLTTLRSFGVPFLYPLSPLEATDLKDTFIRTPIWALFTRPKMLSGDRKELDYRMNIDYRKKED